MQPLDVDHRERDVKTMAPARTAAGIAAVREKKSTSRTARTKTSWATWLVAPTWSAMAVCVGLPLTTKVPLNERHALAAARPRMSASSSTAPGSGKRRPRRGRALRDDHDEAGCGNRQKGEEFAPGDAGKLRAGSPREPGLGQRCRVPRSGTQRSRRWCQGRPQAGAGRGG